MLFIFGQENLETKNWNLKVSLKFENLKNENWQF